MSVLHSNGEIVMSSERRFQNYEDRPSNVVSYSKLPSMKFSDGQSKVYKGASLGYGSKVDFSQQNKDSPGVGSYRLPSIFDRYWYASFCP